MSKTNRQLSFLTGGLVAFLAAAAFWLSFATLRDLAVQQGIHPDVAWLYPAIIDGAIIVFSLSVVQVSLAGERPRYPWVLVGMFTLLSVGLNILHASADTLAQLMAAIPPVALFLSFELLMNQIKRAVKRQTVGQTLAELEQTHATLQAELTRLQTAIAAADETLRVRQAALQDLHVPQLRVGELEGDNPEPPPKQNGHWNSPVKPDRARPQRGRMAKIPHNGQPVTANSPQLATKDESQAQLLAYLLTHPNASQRDMVKAVRRAKTTIQNYLRELQTQGRLTWGADGWQVMAPASVHDVTHPSQLEKE